MVRCILVLLAATSAASLVLTPAVRAPRSRMARMQFDDEGGMVKEIEEAIPPNKPSDGRYKGKGKSSGA